MTQVCSKYIFTTSSVIYVIGQKVWVLRFNPLFLPYILIFYVLIEILDSSLPFSILVSRKYRYAGKLDTPYAHISRNLGTFP